MYFKGIRFLLITITISLSSTVNSQDTRHQIDSIKSLLSDARDSVKFELLFELFRLNIKGDLNEAGTIAKEALNLAYKLNDTLAIVRANNANGYIKKELGYPRQAIPYFENGLMLAKKKNFLNQVKFLLNNLGLCHEMLSDFAGALEYHLESLKLREVEKDTASIAIALNNIGVVYQGLGDYENAFIYYKRNYQLKKEAKEFYDFEVCLVNLAEVSNVLHKYDEAFSYLEEASKWCKDSTCQQKRIGQMHREMGITLMEKGSLNEAEKEFKESEIIFSELKLPHKVESYYGLAQVRFRLADYSRAIKYLDLAQEVNNIYEIPNYRLKNFLLYSEIYKKTGDYQKASEYQKKYIELNSEIFNADLIRNIARVQTEHHQEQNLRTIAQQDRELSDQELILDQQRLQFLFLGLIAGLIFVAAIVFYRKERRQIRTNLELEKAKQTIENQNKVLVSNNTVLDQRVKERTKELHSSNESLKKVNEELDNFIYKTSHDIRGPLTSLKGITHIALKETTNEAITSYLQKLDLTADKLNKILTRLQIINQINHALLVPELIDFNATVEDIIQIEKRKGIPPNLDIKVKIEEGILIFSDKSILKTILENLIDNAIKFAEPSNRKNSFVQIAICNSENGVTIRVTDNGIGFKNVTPDQVFKMFIRASERSESGGIGMYLTKLSTDKLGGSIRLNTSPDGNTEFTVFLPPDLRLVIKQRDEMEQRLQVERLLLAQTQLESAAKKSNS